MNQLKILAKNLEKNLSNDKQSVLLSPYLNILHFDKDLEKDVFITEYNDSITRYFQLTIQIIKNFNLVLTLKDYVKWLWFLYYKDEELDSQIEFDFPDKVDSDTKKFLYYNFIKTDNLIYNKNDKVFFDSFFYITKANISSLDNIISMQLSSNKIIAYRINQ
jgi:hypothetical protein